MTSDRMHILKVRNGYQKLLLSEGLFIVGIIKKAEH